MVNQQTRVVKVSIFGEEYPIRANVSDEAYVRRIASFVDSRMREVKESMKPSSTTKVAILAALNIADELMTIREEQDQTIRTYRDRLTALSERMDAAMADLPAD